MSKKFTKSLKLLFLLILIAGCRSYAILPASPEEKSNNVKLETTNISENKELEIIKRVSLKNKFKRSPEIQIQNFYKKFNEYSEKNKSEKLADMYSEIYINNDGFDKKTIFKLMEDTTDAYKNIKSDFTIEKINISGNNAAVDIHEIITGQTAKLSNKFNNEGSIYSDSYFTNYMRKEDGKWKITSSTIKKENVWLKYGEAKKMDLEINAPECVPAGSDYEVSIKIKQPDDITLNTKSGDEIQLEAVNPEGMFILGSIVNEKIMTPQETPDDTLRAINSGELARIIKANTENYNEYATASLGITRMDLGPESLALNMTGMAIVMSRVNVINKKNNKKEEEVKNGK